MKRYLILFLVLSTSSLYGLIGGLGINVLQDQFEIPEQEDIFEPLDMSFTTTAIDPPIGAGIFLYLTAIPKVDIEAGYNFSFAKYKYRGDGLEDQEFPIAKGTWYASLQYPFLSPPTFRMYFGIGANGTTWTGIVDTSTLKELNDDGIDLDDGDALTEALLTDISGSHIELGARFKPPVIPYSLNLNARYNMVKGFYDDIDNFLTISLGIAFAI